MKLPADYHMHTPLCRHASGEPVEYARHAVEIGLSEIGFSDHSPMRRDDFDNWRMRFDQLDEYVEKVGRANVRMQFDFYHVQIEAGDLITRFQRCFPVIGHVQVAAVPSRAEPDEGEVNYPALFQMIDRTGYAGWIGCEYKPRGRTEDGLRWCRAYGIGV